MNPQTEDSYRFVGLLAIAGLVWLAVRFVRAIYPRLAAGFKTDPKKIDRWLTRGALIAIILYVLTRM